jgi:hypothetical protein
VYCDKCTKAREAASFATSRSREFAKKEQSRSAPNFTQELQQDKDSSKQEAAAKPGSKDQTIIWLGCGGASLMLFLSLLLYAYPLLFEFDPAAAAAREAAQALEDCRLVFEEIGYVLADGQEPDASMQCAQSPQQNIVRHEGNVVKVLHPNPRLYGLAELYVTSESHEVVMEELSES